MTFRRNEKRPTGEQDRSGAVFGHIIPGKETTIGRLPMTTEQGKSTGLPRPMRAAQYRARRKNSAALSTVRSRVDAYVSPDDMPSVSVITRYWSIGRDALVERTMDITAETANRMFWATVQRQANKVRSDSLTRWFGALFGAVIATGYTFHIAH